MQSVEWPTFYLVAQVYFLFLTEFGVKSFFMKQEDGLNILTYKRDLIRLFVRT